MTLRSRTKISLMEAVKIILEAILEAREEEGVEVVPLEDGEDINQDQEWITLRRRSSCPRTRKPIQMVQNQKSSQEYNQLHIDQGTTEVEVVRTEEMEREAGEQGVEVVVAHSSIPINLQ